MAFFSLLYESEESKALESKNDWMKLKRASRHLKDKSYEYVGNKLVRVQEKEENKRYPEFFEHLNLDSIIEKAYKRETYLKMEDVFKHLLVASETIIYRQEIMKDFEEKACYSAFLSFRNELQELHQIVCYSKEVKVIVQSDSYYLKAICLYGEAIRKLKYFFDTHEVRSRGLNKLKDLLTDYIDSEAFSELEGQANALKEAFEKIHYQLAIDEKKVTVSLTEDQHDYTWALSKLLGQEKENEGHCFTNLHSGIAINSLEEQLIHLISQQYETLFKTCHDFTHQHDAFIETFIQKVEDEILFYLEFSDYMNQLKERGFHFCYPKISEQREMNIHGMYDLSLAQKRQCADEVTVNEIELAEGEKGACITGANQGGKTTFIRAIGQIAYLTGLGLPVPASRAKILPYERIYTHFSEAEDQYTNNGKLKEELIKLEETLASVNDRSLVMMNELFASTTMKDGYELGKRAINEFKNKGVHVFCVTHIMSLAQEDLDLVSLVAEVNKDKRSHKIVRKPVDGLAYTKSLIDKYHLSYEEVKERLNHER